MKHWLSLLVHFEEVATNDKRLDNQAIESLRQAVHSLAETGHGRMPLAEIVGHHPDLAAFDQVTVDFGSQAAAAPIIILRESPRDDVRLEQLSPRERQVARLVADGLANKEIAARLNITTATTKDHVHNILHKIGLPNRAAVAALFGSSN